jgi:SNF2 family DNA or RNA helicase
LGELWSLFDFLMPGFLGSELTFKSQFRTPIEKGNDDRLLEALRLRVAPFVLRRMKDLVAKDLPSKTILVRPVELAGKQRELYESIRIAAHADVRQAIRQQGIGRSQIAILDALMKLRQVCCDPRLVTVPAAREVKQSAKYKMLIDLVQTQVEEGRRILIFSQFTKMLDLIAEGISRTQIPFVSLTGATRDRQAKCDAFESGQADIFLISLKAGGTGLNLTSADTVIHYDPWWNPAAQAQATDRAYRIGQKKPVFVHNLIVSGSVEERMLQLQQRKQHLADAILSPGGSGSTLSEAELDDLFAPLGGEDAAG